MKKIFVLFISLLLSACSTTLYDYHSFSPAQIHEHYKVIELYVDADMDKEARMEFSAAVNEYNYLFNNEMRLTIKDWEFKPHTLSGVEVLKKVSNTHEGVMVMWLDSADPIIEKYMETENGKLMLAFTNGIGDDHANAMVFLKDRIGGRSVRLIALHEIGHLLGADHTNAHSLMYPAYGAGLQTPCIDFITAAQISNYNHLDVHRLNYCATYEIE